MYKTIFTVSDIKRQRLVYYIKEKVVTIPVLSTPQFYYYYTITSVNQIKNVII